MGFEHAEGEVGAALVGHRRFEHEQIGLLHVGAGRYDLHLGLDLGELGALAVLVLGDALGFAADRRQRLELFDQGVEALLAVVLSALGNAQHGGHRERFALFGHRLDVREIDGRFDFRRAGGEQRQGEQRRNGFEVHDELPK